MKKTTLFLIILTASFLLAGCDLFDKDPCKNKDCGKSDMGGCFDGNCECVTGVSIGADGKCSLFDRDEFTGIYDKTRCAISVVVNGQNSPLFEPQMTITEGSGKDGINIDIPNAQVLCSGSVDKGKITIPLSTNGNFQYSGNGQLVNTSTKKITLNKTDLSNGLIYIYTIQFN